MTRVELLDHGYLELIESWGSDEAIISAARMSTGKGFLGWGSRCKNCRAPFEAVTGLYGTSDHLCPGCQNCYHSEPGDERLLRYLYENKHCYDSETEVLTDRGFMLWGDVTGSDRLGQWDGEIDSLVYEQAIGGGAGIVQRRHRGQMYRVDHGGVDLLVTDNHKMLVKTKVSVPNGNRQEWSTWGLVRASELGHRSMVRYRKHATYRAASDIDLTLGRHAPIFPPQDDTRALLRLIGFFIGDGHAGGTYANAISFHLRKQRKVTFLREVCAELNWELREGASDIFSVRNDRLTELFRSQFYGANGEKVIPEYLLRMNADDSAALLDGLRNSDGSEKRGAWAYYSTSHQVAESVQRLVLHAGGAAHVANNDGYMYRVMVLSRMTEPVINQGKRNTELIEDWSGDVYCAHTRTGVLIVRRNGKIVLSGNSSPFEMAGLNIEVQAPIFVFREWMRHRTQSFNEMSARYTPLPDLNYVPTVERLMARGGVNKQAGSIGTELTEVNAERFRKQLAKMYTEDEELYQNALAAGVPKELARVCLPVGRYSRMRASGNLRNWLAFLTLRMAPAAQFEIRTYAEAIGGIIAEKFPRTWALFEEWNQKR
jgi:thymidylate synthase (FAD)